MRTSAYGSLSKLKDLTVLDMGSLKDGIAEEKNYCVHSVTVQFVLEFYFEKSFVLNLFK